MTNNKEISRRSFLKLMGAAGATAVGVASCDGASAVCRRTECPGGKGRN